MLEIPMPAGQSHDSRDAWPFFIVIDASESMTWPDENGTRPLDSAYDGLNTLLTTLEEETEALQNTWYEVIAFAGNANVHLPLSKAEEMPEVAPLKPGTWTNYAAAWELVSARTVEGYRRLVSDGYDVARPVIFFITDGNPGGENIEQTEADWAHYITDMNKALGDNKAPRIITLGVGRVNREILLLLHSKRPHGAAAVALPGYSTTSLMKSVLLQIQNSIVNSAGRGRFFWECPEGMENLCNREVH